MFKYILVFSVLCASISFANINIAGKVINADGKPPVLAHAHISVFGESIYRPIESKQISENGKFNFELNEGQYYSLYITAANHIGYLTPIITDEKDLDINLEIQLDAIEYENTFENVKIIGDWNGFSFRSADDMSKQNDGTFFFEVQSDSPKVGYQIMEIDKNGHSVNGTMYDELIYDGGGDYRSYIMTRDGSAKIIFDPAKLIKTPKNTAKISIKGNKIINQIAQINHKVNIDQKKWRKERNQYAEINKSTDGFNFNFEPIAKFLEEKMNSKNDLIRRYAAMRYVSTIHYGYTGGDAQKTAEILRITDPLWAANNFSLIDIYTAAYGPEKTQQLINANFENITSHRVKATLLALQGIEAKKEGNLSKVTEIHKELKEKYSDQQDLRWYVNQIDPSKAVFIGKQVPKFEIKLLHSDEIVSDESMLGKFYLMDFWAVWCAPCRAEMPNLHAIYDDFKNKNFTILSLSFDPKIEHVDAYRKQKWSMPWLHTFVEGGFDNDLSKRFEVSGIPKPVLVDPKGKIIATDIDLRGENLRETLNKFIKTTM